MNNRINQIESDKKLFEARVTQEVKIMQSSMNMQNERLQVVSQMASSFVRTLCCKLPRKRKERSSGRKSPASTKKLTD